MFDFLQKALNGSDSTISSRRLITLISVMVGVIVDIAIIVLSFKVALSTTANTNGISAINKLIELAVIIKVEIFLLIGIITWQNINDTASIVKGLPITQTERTALFTERVTPAAPVVEKPAAP